MLFLVPAFFLYYGSNVLPFFFLTMHLKHRELCEDRQVPVDGGVQVDGIATRVYRNPGFYRLPQSDFRARFHQAAKIAIC